MWLTNCVVVDVESGDRSERRHLRIEQGVIVEIADTGPSKSSDVLDLQGRFLMPGLIDCHTHFTEVFPFSSADADEPAAVSVLRALHFAEQALFAGVTTVRCLHEKNRADTWLRMAASNGWVQVPSILAAGRAISTTGGHGDIGLGCAIADGPEAFSAAVREELAAGADHIKIFISGGIADASENLDVVQMSREEISAVVAVAQEQGKYVVAHSANSASIELALEAGVRSFEHAYQLDEGTASHMRRLDAFLTPTLCVTHCPDWMRASGFEESQIDRAEEIAPIHRRSIETAIQAGVRLVSGTDGHPGDSIDGTSLAVVELELMSSAGLSTRGSLQAGTINAATLLGIDDQVGVVREGAVADLIAMTEDPVADVSALRTLEFVMRKGEVVRGGR